MTTPGPLYTIADELRSIADMGLRFTEEAYDRERYERILALSARLVNAADGRDPADVLAIYQDNLSHVSPNCGGEAVVIRDGKILLIRRGDNGLWAMPGGFTDVGETIARTAQRELQEEAGIVGEVTRMLGIFDSLRWRDQVMAQIYTATFLVDAPDGNPVHSLPETTDVGFFAEDELPPLSTGHNKRVPLVFRLLRGELPLPYFDKPEKSGDSPTD